MCGTWSETSAAPSELTQFWQIQDTERILISCPRHVSSRLVLAVKSANTPWRLLPKKTWRDSLPTDMILSSVSFLVVALLRLQFPEGLMNDLYISRQAPSTDVMLRMARTSTHSGGYLLM
jgi:hypothetical protein